MHLVDQLKVRPRQPDRFGFNGGLVEIKSAKYGQNFLLAPLTGEPIVSERTSPGFALNPAQDVWGQQQMFEQLLQRSPEGVVDDAGSVTAQSLDLPDDRRQIGQIDLLDNAVGLDLLLQRWEQGCEFVGRFGDQ